MENVSYFLSYLLACVVGIWKGRERDFLKLPFPSLSNAWHAG